MKRAFGVMGLVVMGVTLLTSMPVQAQTRDIDFDWLMSTVDRLLSGFAPGITIKLGDRDNDGNGMWEADSLAMLSAVMRGGTRVAGINAGDVTNVQAAFLYNRGQVAADMAATGFTCTVLGIAGYPCRLVDILTDAAVLGPIAGGMVSNLLLDYMAGVTTIADNPATFNFANSFIYNIIESFAGSVDSSLWGTVRGLEVPAQVGLTISNYHNWGATPHTGSGARNMFGSAGDFDRDGTTNITEYTAAGYTGSPPNTWRENFMVSNLIPLAQTAVRFTNMPQASDNVNHIQNGDFAGGTTNWTPGGGWSINTRGASSPTGPFQVMAHAAGAANTLVQPWANQNPSSRIQPNTVYRVELTMLACNGAGSNIRVTLGNGTISDPMTSTTGDVVGGDTRHVYVTSGPAANPNFILTPDTTGFWIDNVVINVGNLAGDYMDFGTATTAGGNAPFTLLWEDAGSFPGDKDDTSYVFYHLVNMADGTPGDPTESGIRGTSTYHVIYSYLLPSQDGDAPWLRLSDTYTPPSFTSATVHNPANPQGSPPPGCIEADALGGRTTPMSIVRVGARAFAISPQPVGAHLFVGQSIIFTSGAVGGDSVPLYQWYKDSSPITNQTANTLSRGPLVLGDAGTYVFRATNLAGSLDSDGAVLEVATALTWTSQPAGANKAAGGSHTMTVSTSGGFAPITYQWYKGGLPIANATTTTLALTNLAFANEGTYTCVATDKYSNTITSNGAVLTVLDILTAPSSATVFTGSPANFSVTPRGGSGAYTYQWRKNTIAIANATLSTYNIPTCVMSDDADYTCLVSDAFVSLLAPIPPAAPAHLTVTAAPLNVTTQPAGGSKYVGDSHTFTVVVSAGSGFTKTYQWQKNQVDIPGANASSLLINPLAAGDAGNYRCVVGEIGVRPPAGLVISSEVPLNVQPRMSVTLQPVGGNKAVGGSHSFTVTVTGGYTPYIYQWRKNGTPVYTGQTYNLSPLAAVDQATAPGYTCFVTDSVSDNTTSNPAVLTVLAILTSPSDRDVNAGSPTTFTVVPLGGSGVPGYTYQWRKGGAPIANATNASYTISQVLPADAGSYACLVSDSAVPVPASLLSGSATLTVTVQTISISTQPVGGNLYVGGSKTFTCVGAGGNGTLTYQWQKDGSDLTNQTSTTLVLNPLALGDQGNYQCLVGDLAHPPLAKVGSNTANLQVRNRMSITAQPSGGNKAVGGTHSFSITVTDGYTPLTYQWYKGAAPVSTANPYTLGTLVAGDQATYRCVATDNNGDTVTSNNVDLTVLAIQTSPADREVAALDPTTFTVVPLPGSGFGAYNYQWRKDGSPIGNATNASYTIDSCVPADEGNYDCIVGDAGGASLTSAAAHLTVLSNPIIIDTPTTPPVPPKKYVGPASGFNFTCAAHGGSGTITYQWQRDGSDLVGETTNTLAFTTFALSDAGVYQCMIGDDVHPPLAKVGSGQATLQVANRVSITTQPAGGHKAAGSSHSFTIVATGGYAPLSYQWYFGATPVYNGGATYTLPNLTVADQGSYRCVVKDSFTATTNSSTVSLYVLDIETPPASGTVNVGDTAAFSVTVAPGSGIAPYTYQWKYKGVNISGATTSSYSKSSVQAGSPDGNPAPVNPTGNAGDYVCQVTDSNPNQVSLDSAAAILTVNYTPMSVSLQPMGGDKYTGGSHTFTVQATGGAGAPYTYQWQKGGLDISGKTTDTLAISPLALADDGDYRCMLGMVGVRPPMPLIASDPATLRVRDPLAITTEPLGANKAAGDNHTFTVAASGGFTPLAYQWYRGAIGAPPGTGTAVGSNSDTLALTGLAAGDQGTYSCVITDAATGSVTSAAADLRVLAIATQPSSQTVDARQPVTFTVEIVADAGLAPYTYQWTYKGGDIPGATDASYAIASCQAGSPDAVPQPLNPTGNAGDYTCVVRDAGSASLTSDTATLTVNMLPITFTEQPAAGRKYVGGQHTLHVAVSGGAGPAYTYQWTKEGSNITDATLDTLVLNPLALSDGAVYSCLIGEVGVRPPEALVPSDSVTLDVVVPMQIDTQPAGADLYIGETFTATVAASGGFSPLTYQWFKGAAPLGGETNATLSVSNVQLLDAGSYHCVVSDDVPTPLASADAVLTVSPPISITTQPVGGEAEGGQPWSFSIEATGGKGVLHYAWTKNGVPIGTDSPTYAIATAGLTDAGTYLCTVSDSGSPPSSVPSSPAILTIHAIFAIDQQPQNTKAYTNGPASLSVHATFNRGDLSYQWYLHDPDVAIVGATADPLAFSAVTSADVGTYFVTVTDDNGTPANTADDVTLTSDLADLAVADHLAVGVQPQSGNRPIGGSYTFTVSTTGGFSPLSYEWYKDAKGLVGTEQDLTLTDIQEVDFGTYYVVIRDAHSDVIESAPATLALGSGLPVAGVGGLGLLAAASLLYGAVRLRRRR